MTLDGTNTWVITDADEGALVIDPGPAISSHLDAVFVACEPRLLGIVLTHRHLDHSEGAALLAELTYDALRDDNLDYVGGLEMGAVPLAGALAQLSWLKNHPIAAFFVRKKPKEHGARLAVEGLAKGETLEGKRIVIVEDVTTTGGSAVKALDAVREAGGEVVLVFTMVDRDEGAAETFAKAGVAFRSLYKAGEFLKG